MIGFVMHLEALKEGRYSVCESNSGNLTSINLRGVLHKIQFSNGLDMCKISTFITSTDIQKPKNLTLVARDDRSRVLPQSLDLGFSTSNHPPCRF